jgi:hypothetical protein
MAEAFAKSKKPPSPSLETAAIYLYWPLGGKGHDTSPSQLGGLRYRLIE